MFRSHDGDNYRPYTSNVTENHTDGTNIDGSGNGAQVAKDNSKNTTEENNPTTFPIIQRNDEKDQGKTDENGDDPGNNSYMAHFAAGVDIIIHRSDAYPQDCVNNTTDDDQDPTDSCQFPRYT